MIKYRKMEMSDYEDINKLYKRSKKIVLYSTDDKKGFKLFLSKNKDLCFVATYNNKIIGSIQGATDYKRGYIHHLIVHNDYRKKGIGKKLVSLVINALKKSKLSDVVILVNNKNKSVISFYKKIGFQFLTVNFGYVEW